MCARASRPSPPRFHVCLQQALAERNGSAGAPESEHNDGEEDAKGMARLFAEVGEAYTGLIAEGGPQVGRLRPAAARRCAARVLPAGGPNMARGRCPPWALLGPRATRQVSARLCHR